MLQPRGDLDLPREPRRLPSAVLSGRRNNLIERLLCQNADRAVLIELYGTSIGTWRWATLRLQIATMEIEIRGAISRFYFAPELEQVIVFIPGVGFAEIEKEVAAGFDPEVEPEVAVAEIPHLRPFNGPVPKLARDMRTLAAVLQNPS